MGKISSGKFTNRRNSDTLNPYERAEPRPVCGDGAGLSRHNYFPMQIITVLAIGQMGTGL